MNLFSEAKKVLDKDGKVNPLGPYGKQKLTGREISTYFRRNKVNDATIKKAVEVALDLGGADTIARQEIKKFYGDKVLKSKEVQNALKYANESFTYNQSLNQISEENLVEKNLMPDIQKIVDTKGAKKVGGIMVDMFTASMINQIYNKVNDSNKKKMEKSNISTLVDLAQRMMQKMGDNLEEGRYSRHVKIPKVGSKEYMDNLKKSIDKTTGHLKPSKNPGLYKDGKKIKDVDAYLKSKRRKRSRNEEAVSPAQQAAIAISKKEKGEKPKNEDAVAKAKLTLKHTQDMQKLKDKQAREKESMSESDMQNVDDAPKHKFKALGFSQHPHKGFEDERLPKDMRDFRKKAKTPSQMRVEDAYKAMWEDGQKYAPQLDEEVVSEGMKMKDIMRKHKRELNKAYKSGDLSFMSSAGKKAEDDLMKWAMDNGEVKTDDPDDFFDWLSRDLEDIVKGKIKEDLNVMDSYRKMWEDGQKYAPQLDEEVANITVDPRNKISKPADQNKHAMEIAKQAKRFGLKSSMMGKHVRLKGAKKAVNDFLRIIIGKSSYGDPTEKDMSTPQVDKMLTKGLK